MVVRLSDLRAGHPLPPGRFLVLISVRGSVDPRAIERLEGLGQLKNPMTSSGIEPAISRIVSQCLNLLLLLLLLLLLSESRVPGIPRTDMEIQAAVDLVSLNVYDPDDGIF
jgi:hypothetical protein